VKRRDRADCERAMQDDSSRVLLVKDQLTKDEALCLLGLSDNNRFTECDKAGVPGNTGVVQYLHGKGIFLECEDRSEHQ